VNQALNTGNTALIQNLPLQVRKQVNDVVRLTEEIGDLMCMIQLVQESGIVDLAEVMFAAGKKRVKLKEWSKVYEN
jgi:hypothetical protein